MTSIYSQHLRTARVTVIKLLQIAVYKSKDLNESIAVGKMTWKKVHRRPEIEIIFSSIA